MRRYMVIVLVLLALCSAASAANLVNWTGKLLPTSPTNPPGWVDVVVNATEQSAGLWLWTYDITPTGTHQSGYANQLTAFSLDLGSDALAGLISGSISSSYGWNDNTTSSSIQWFSNKLPTGSSNVIYTGLTARFQFLNKLGPYVMNFAYAQDHGQYASRVPTPMVPEPMSIMLGTLGLGVVSGLRKLRRK